MNLIGTLKYGEENLSVYETTYRESGTVAVVVQDEMGVPYCKMSTFVENLNLPPNEFVVTHNTGGKLRQALLESGLFEETNTAVSYGFVKDQPVWRLKEQA
jgi:hypothetical protein